MAPNEDDAISNTVKIKDPLGVIERCAKQIWIERGASAGTTWRDYFAEAEELLLSGRSTPIAETGTKFVKGASQPETIPPGIWELRDQDADPFAAVLACSIEALLNEHEAFCLTMLLRSTEYKLKGRELLRRCEDEEIVAFLVLLAGEYEEAFVKREGGNLAAVSREKRSEYWREMIREWRSAEYALTFHDRNTIDRLKDAIARHPFVECVHVRHCE